MLDAEGNFFLNLITALISRSHKLIRTLSTDRKAPIALLLEEQWSKLAQVVPPHHPGVISGSFNLLDLHIFAF